MRAANGKFLSVEEVRDYAMGTKCQGYFYADYFDLLDLILVR